MDELAWGLIGIAGVILGMLISWLITHEYARRQELIKQRNQVYYSRLVDYPLERVWDVVANPIRFKHFTLYDIVEEDVRKVSVRQGAAFRSSHMCSLVYIVDFKSFRQISFGPTPNEWEHYLYLTQIGDKTEIFLGRRFRVYEADQSWWQSIMERLFPASRTTTTELTVDTMNRIESAIEQYPQTC